MQRGSLTWTSNITSSNAWMSIKDARIVGDLIDDQAATRTQLSVLEWGAGTSTIFHTDHLRAKMVNYYWLALEHNRNFFEQSLAQSLPSADVYLAEELPCVDLVRPSKPGQLSVVVWNGMEQNPPDCLAGMRTDLDDYVSFPSRLGERFDLVIVDGRMRSRCMSVARELLSREPY